MLKWPQTYIALLLFFPLSFITLKPMESSLQENSEAENWQFTGR